MSMTEALREGLWAAGQLELRQPLHGAELRFAGGLVPCAVMSDWLLLGIPVVVIGVVVMIFLTRWSFRIIMVGSLALIALVLAGLTVAGLVVGWNSDRQMGPERLYTLSLPVTRINEPVAWRCALRALESEARYRGFDWRPVPINRSLTSESAQPYRYLWLNNPSGTRGTFTVTNAAGMRVHVRVELDGQLLRVRRVTYK